MKKLILASTSVYRRKLLERLAISFEAVKPLFDEEKHKDSSLSPSELAKKLAYLKAESLTAVGSKFASACIIGGDQLVSLEGEILGKPHNRGGAVEQLFKLQGKTHELITAVCVLDGPKRIDLMNVTEIRFRSWSRAQLENYVDLDQPLDCAGSYKFELHGVALIESLNTKDPTAIEGLPLIELSKILQERGYENFSKAN